MTEKKNPWLVFMEDAPEVAKAYKELMGTVNKNQALDEKTKFLILVGIYSALREEDAFRHFVQEAIKAGARKEEVRAASLLPFTLGVISAEHSVPIIMEVFNQTRPSGT